jgi:hypothetical protein
VKNFKIKESATRKIIIKFEETRAKERKGAEDTQKNLSISEREYSI